MFPRTSLTTLPDHLRWRCETVEGGTEVTGVLAGLPVPVRTHWNGSKTLPCLADLTCKELFCPCTVKGMSGTTTVYTPFITKEGEKIVVPASPLVGEQIMKFNPGKLLTLFRPKKRCAALRIMVPTEDAQTQTWVKRVRPTCLHSIEEYLLHLWQIPALNKHFGIPFRPAVGTKLIYDDTTGAITVKEE